MKKFDLKKMIAENKATFFSSLNKDMGLTPLQQYIYDFETDISGPDIAEEQLDNIKKINNLGEVEDYYVNYRGWEDDRDLRPYLRDLMRNLAKQFPDLAEGKMTKEGKAAYEYEKGKKAGEEIEKKKMKENLDSSYDDLYDFVDQKMVEGDEEAEMLLNSNPSYDDLYDFVDQKMVEGDEEAEALLNKINNVNENKSSKMKVSELKAKIKEMVLAEMTLDVNDETSEVDFLAELEEMLNENSPMNDPRVEQIISMLKDLDVDGETMEYILRQVGMEDQMASQLVRNKMELDSVNEMKTMMGSKFDEERYEGSDDHFQDTIDESGLWPALMKFKDEGFSLEHVVGWIEANWYMINEADEKAAEEEAAADVTVDDTETTDVETTAEVNPNVKAVQDSLTQAQAAAQKLGDKKLIDQIGNTITFFTRTHVVEKPGGAME